MASRSVAPQGGRGQGSKPHKVPNKPNKPNKPRTSQTVANRANQSRQRQRGQSKMFGSVGGFEGVDPRMVRQLVNQTVRPDLMAMRDDRDYVNRQADRAIGDANSLYNRSVGDLNYVFGEAADYTQSLGSQIGAGYDQTMQQVAGIDAGTGQAIQGNADAASQAITSELQRLGMGGQAGVDPNLQGDAAFAKSQAAQVAGNNQANLAASKQSANTLTSLLGGMLQGSHASNLGQASQNRQVGINDINRAKQDDMSGITEAMQQLRATKPGMIRDMLLQLQAQGFDQWQAIQALNMDRRQMNHGFAMDNAQMAQQSAYYGTGAQAWGSQAAQPGSPGSYSSSTGPAKNQNWGASTGRPTKPGPKPPKRGGRKGGRVSGSQNDAIYGPLAGGI